jgi:hypothetical protein
MPSTLWSAPVAVGNNQPFVQSTITAAVLDITPSGASNVGGTYEIPAGMLNLGTRLRIVAWGSYIATTTASTMAFGFYMNNPGTTILTTPAVLTLGPAVTAVASTMPWMLEYWGLIAATSNVTGTAGSIVGRGRFSSPATGWTTAPAETIAPQTVGAQTVAQTATGMITYNSQCIQVGCTVTTATGLTSITTNELTCEILG